MLYLSKLSRKRMRNSGQLTPVTWTLTLRRHSLHRLRISLSKGEWAFYSEQYCTTIDDDFAYCYEVFFVLSIHQFRNLLTILCTIHYEICPISTLIWAEKWFLLILKDLINFKETKSLFMRKGGFPSFERYMLMIDDSKLLHQIEWLHLAELSAWKLQWWSI